MPRVEFVNLSLNRLGGPIEIPQPWKMDRLRSLVLNNTKLEWYGVETLLQLLPVLEELHLSLNDYTHVLLDTTEEDANGCQTAEEPASGESESCQCSSLSTQSSQDKKHAVCKKTEAHHGIKKLHLTGNHISEWSEICRVGRLFPNLEALVLADCPLR